MKSGIYKIENSINGKLYIGSSKNIKERWKLHQQWLCEGYHPNPHLSSSWKKYGEDAFEWGVALICKKEDLFIYEKIFMDYYRVTNREFGYNISEFPGGGMAPGWHHKEETKKKISKANKGRTWWEEQGKPHPMQGKKLSKETIAKRQNSRKLGAGFTCSEENKKATRERMLGNKYGLGIKQSEETKQKKRRAMLGRKTSELHKKVVKELAEKRPRDSKGCFL